MNIKTMTLTELERKYDMHKSVSERLADKERMRLEMNTEMLKRLKICMIHTAYEKR